MSSPATSRPKVCFGDFAFDPQIRTVSKNGSRLKLQGQPIEILGMLLERPGQVVTREAIQRRLWPEGTFVEFEHSLNAAVMRLREALGDNAENPKYIETVPKRGYRLIADLEVRDSSAEELDEIGRPAIRPSIKWKVLWVLPVLALIVAVGILLFEASRPSVQAYDAVQFTTMQGVATQPAISPDGKEIAFAFASQRELGVRFGTGGEGGPNRIHAQVTGSTSAHSLTDDPGPLFSQDEPHWWPDGSSIAYLVSSPGHTIYGAGLPNQADELWTVARSGGVPRKFFTSAMLLFGFDIAPDGRSIVISESAAPEQPMTLFVVELDTMKRRRLTWPPEQELSARGSYSRGDRAPRFSHDGSAIAFIRRAAMGEDIWVVPTNGGSPQQLTNENEFLPVRCPFAWMPDGKSMIIAASHESIYGLWRVGLRDHGWKPISIGAEASYPVVSKDGSLLAFQRGRSYANIWRFDLARLGSATREPQDLTQSIRNNLSAVFSPDGRRITFQSSRSGLSQIYVMNSDGSNLVQLTYFTGSDHRNAGAPRFSPDGKEIAFDLQVGDHSHLFAVDSNGGTPRQITSGDTDNYLPRYSRDGQWIHFTRQRQGGSDVWRVPVAGGTPELILANATMAEESWDGQTLFYIQLFRGGIFEHNRRGPDRLLIPDAVISNHGVSMVVEPDGIYYPQSSPSKDPMTSTADIRLMFFDFAKRESRTVLTFPPFTRPYTNFGIAPDRSAVLMSRGEPPQWDIMLIKNFKQ